MSQTVYVASSITFITSIIDKMPTLNKIARIDGNSQTNLWKRGDSSPDTTNYTWEKLELTFDDDFDLDSFVNDNECQASIITLEGDDSELSLSSAQKNSAAKKNSAAQKNSSIQLNSSGLKRDKLTLQQYENIPSNRRQNGLNFQQKNSGVGPPFSDTNNKWSIAYMVRGKNGNEFYMISGANSAQDALAAAEQHITTIFNSRL